MGLKEPALATLTREAYKLLGLQSYFTAGPEGNPRLDDPHRRHRPAGGRRDPHRLRDGLHPRRDLHARRPQAAQDRGRHQGRGQDARRGQGLRHAGRRHRRTSCKPRGQPHEAAGPGLPVEDAPAGTDHRATSARGREYRKRCWITFGLLGAFPLVGLGVTALESAGASPGWMAILFFGWGTLVYASEWRRNSIRCPRCGELFFRRQGSVAGARCRSCKLPKWATYNVPRED